MSGRAFDIAVFGATGYTGRHVAEHLVATAPPTARLALAGRDARKLDAIAAAMPGRSLGRIVADSGDPASLRALAEAAQVVCTTVGPYQKYGLPLVEACAQAGTHLCDINGETLYVKDCIDRFDAEAQRTGARIVNSCGFDSIPSDLGVWVLHQAAGEPLDEVVLAVDSMRGGFSGGTLASFAITLDVAREDRARRKILFDPYALSPDRAAEPDLGPQRDQQTFQKDALVGAWTAPFVMASINTRIVRRSNALLGYAYGRSLRYRETVVLKPRPMAFVRGAVLPLGFAGISRARKSALGRRLVDRLLPPPGSGPKEAARLAGSFRIRVLGRTVGGKQWQVRIFGEGDPGYAATARILGEAALALAFDGARLPSRGGVLTPAVALAPTLVERLNAQRVTFDAEPR